MSDPERESRPRVHWDVDDNDGCSFSLANARPGPEHPGLFVEQWLIGALLLAACAASAAGWVRLLG